MAVPTWLSAVGHFASDVVGTMFGIQIAEARKQGAETVARELKRVLTPDREDIMKEILYIGNEVKDLRDLLVKAEEGFIETEDGKRYAENWIINMLLKVDPIDRGWVFRMLNEVLEVHGPKEFFVHLNILHNDGWLQYLKLVKIVFEEKFGKFREKLPKLNEATGKVDDWAANTAAPAIERFNRWLDSKGVR